MNLQHRIPSSTAAIHERTEKLIYRWLFLLEQGRSELHLKQWFIASSYYQQAMQVAESLFAASLCKNCALRCYMRTLVEYAYVICKIQGEDSIELLEQAATLTLSCYVPMDSIDKFLEPLFTLKNQSDAERELWLNRLFAGDAIYKQQLH